MSSQDLSGKIALITGASRGIGAAIADTLAQAGAKVIGTATSENGAAAIGGRLAQWGGEGRVLDSAAEGSIEALIGEIEKANGKLDVLVNNAGIAKDRTLAKMTVEEWQKVIDVNLTSVFNCSKAALPMIIANRGNIVSMSSFSGLRGNFGQTNYTAAKAGIIGFTKTLSKEVGKFGVRVNAVAPGFIESKMTEAMPEEVKAMVKKLTSLARTGKPEEVAAAIAFLASDQAGFITGEVLNVDGGLWL